MAILLSSIAAVGLAGATSVFLLYVPLLPALVVSVIVLGLAAAFGLGIHGGLWLAAHKADEEVSVSELAPNAQVRVKNAELSAT